MNTFRRLHAGVLAVMGLALSVAVSAAQHPSRRTADVSAGERAYCHRKNTCGAREATEPYLALAAKYDADATETRPMPRPIGRIPASWTANIWNPGTAAHADRLRN